MTHNPKLCHKERFEQTRPFGGENQNEVHQISLSKANRYEILRTYLIFQREALQLGREGADGRGHPPPPVSAPKSISETGA